MTIALFYYDGFGEFEIVAEQVVVDGNLITAQGQAYAEFAVELARQMGLYEKPEDYENLEVV
jgi:putative intracellular protease/amidase